MKLLSVALITVFTMVAFSVQAIQETPLRLEAFPDVIGKVPPIKIHYPEDDFTDFTRYVYSEVPMPRIQDAVMASLKDVPMGSILDEIKRAADLFGIDYNFLVTVARIESDFNPRNCTGQYCGLFQLSRYEFNRYGTGNIFNPRDNAIAAANKIAAEAIIFSLNTKQRPTQSQFYLIHQQGIQGAEQHTTHPERVAWQSMCATDEGKQKGQAWCKKAIWGNTLPAIKAIVKTVEDFTSGAFVKMWQERERQFLKNKSVPHFAMLPNWTPPEHVAKKHEKKKVREAKNHRKKHSHA